MAIWARERILPGSCEYDETLMSGRGYSPVLWSSSRQEEARNRRGPASDAESLGYILKGAWCDRWHVSVPSSLHGGGDGMTRAVQLLYQLWSRLR